MALVDVYPEDFEILWRVYPKWPTGRSKKMPSYKAFCAAKRLLKFTSIEIDVIRKNIETRVLNCATWQHDYRSPRDGRPVGPPMFSTYMNQRLWNEVYDKKQVRDRNGNRREEDADDRPEWQKQRYASEAAYRSAVNASFETQRKRGFGLH